MKLFIIFSGKFCSEQFLAFKGQRLGQEGGVQGFEDWIWKGGLDNLTVIGLILFCY